MRRTLLFCILFFSPAMTVSAIVETQPKWTRPQIWRQNLRAKMTDSMVRSVLGEPTDREATSSAMIWYYHECPTRVDGKVSHRPHRGIVRFRLVKVNAAGQRLDKPYFAVVDWIEPDWDEVEAELQIKKAQAQAQAEAAERLAQAQKARIAAEQELEKQRIEREKLEREKLLEAQRRVIQEQARAETERERLEIEEAGKWLGFQKEYWYFAGGGFIVAVVLIPLFRRVGSQG